MFSIKTQLLEKKKSQILAKNTLCFKPGNNLNDYKKKTARKHEKHYPQSDSIT